MGARKRRSKRGVFEKLVAGKVNTSEGTWVEDRGKESERFVERAARNAARNRANREKQKVRRGERWERARESAREELRRKGDTSEPLVWFVRRFFYKTKE